MENNGGRLLDSKIIYNLKEDEHGLGWLEGKFESKSLFQGEIDITIMNNTDVAIKYAEKCIAHYNALNNNKELLGKIEKSLEKFMLYMYEEWQEMGIFDNIVEGINPVIKGFKEGNSLLKYLTNPGIYIELPEDIDEIGYVIQTECPWEPEHMCAIIIRENELRYVGPSEGNTPWDDEDEYYCFWNENVDK